MKRIALTVSVLAVGLLAVPQAQAKGTTLRFNYVAWTGTYVYVGLEHRVAEQRTPAGQAAVLGYFSFLPTSPAFTLAVNDLGALPGQAVPVWVNQRVRGSSSWRVGCVPVGVPTRFAGFRSGVEVVVIVSSDAATLSLKCSGHAVSGTVDVSL